MNRPSCSMGSRGLFVASSLAVLGCNEVAPFASTIYDASTIKPVTDAGTEPATEVVEPLVYECAEDGRAPEGDAADADAGASDADAAASDADAGLCSKVDPDVMGFCDEVRAIVHADWPSVEAELCRAGVLRCTPIPPDKDGPRMWCRVAVHYPRTEEDRRRICAVAALAFVDGVGCYVAK
ncbi:MAG: hypothetical protein IPJ34_04180 [Myxococcales bacterium]|nr:hypothetical protein [Myxococcales bacterium]